MVWKIRRVVTGHDKNGRSVFLQDGNAGNIKQMESMPGLALTDLWETTGAPANNEGKEDAAKRPVRLEPPAGGTIVRIVEFPPDSQWRGKADAKAAFDSIGAGHAKDKSNADPMMHKTATVDYIIVLKGKIFAIMEEGEKLLKRGDILIQRGTNHSWSVRGKKPCVVAAILVSAKPVGAAKAGSKAGKKKPATPVKKAAAKTARRAPKPARKAAQRPAKKIA